MIQETNNVINETITTKYLKTLSEKEKIGIEIAKNQLGSSFCLERSLGYIQFLKIYKDENVTNNVVQKLTPDNIQN